MGLAEKLILVRLQEYQLGVCILWDVEKWWHFRCEKFTSIDSIPNIYVVAYICLYINIKKSFLTPLPSMI